MNANLQLANELNNTGKGNRFVIFGEPNITVRLPMAKGAKVDDIAVQSNGIDVFPPANRRSPQRRSRVLVHRHQLQRRKLLRPPRLLLFRGDPYKSLKTTLKAEINSEAWANLNSDTSRLFDKPKTGHIAVKVIYHLGDEVMKVFQVS